MPDTKISALTAATAAAAANELAINEAGTSKKLTVDLLREFICKRAAANTVAAGEFITWLVLAANSSNIVLNVLTTVMTITGVGVGRYHYRCMLIYQSDTATVGIDVAVNHTGTTTQFLAEWRACSTRPTASTGAPTMISVGATGNIYDAQGTRTKNAVIGGGTVSVDTASADMMMMIEGFFVVSVSGDLEIKMATELGTTVVKAMQGSFLELEKLS